MERLITRLGLATGLYGLPLIIAVILMFRIRRESPVALDRAILEAIHQVSSPALDTAMTWLTRTADYPAIMVIITFMTVLLWGRRRFTDAIFLLAGVGGATALNILLKELFYRPRPELWPHLVVESGYSFPSGHAMMSSALVFCLAWLAWPTRWRVPVLVVGALYILGIGLSRLYIGVHYPTDVVAGWCFGLLWVLIIAAGVYGRWIGLGRLLRR